MRMAQTGNRRTARRVEIALALGIDDIGALPAHGDRQAAFEVAVEDVGLCRVQGTRA
jgi:hypothetical protein